MKTLVNLKLIGISTLLAGLAACDNTPPGPAESAGRKIDQTVEDAGRKIGEASDQAAISMARQSDKVGTAIDDAEITTKVKAAIFAEPGLKTLQIGVDTVQAVVTLSGSVDSQQSSDRTSALAGAVAGVERVDNRLAIKSGN